MGNISKSVVQQAIRKTKIKIYGAKGQFVYGLPVVGTAPKKVAASPQIEPSPDPLRTQAAQAGRVEAIQVKDQERPPVDNRSTMQIASEVLQYPDEWLATPNTQFGDRKPIDLIHSGEEEKVRNLLRAAELGTFS